MFAANLEFVQVGIRPAQDGLQNVMQRIEPRAAIEVDAAPDGRLDAHQFNTQDVEVGCRLTVAMFFGFGCGSHGESLYVAAIVQTHS